MKSALVVLSGGQDSATCLAWALVNFDHVTAISFDYKQKHSKELDSAKAMCEVAGIVHKVFPVPVLAGNLKSGLTNDSVDVHELNDDGLPKSFVPGRNLIFLTSAASIALSEGVTDIVTGVCQTDYSGYPDCRRETIDALEKAISLGSNKAVKIHTPLMYLTKAETVSLASRLPRGLQLVGLSWTCYIGGQSPCGSCPACVLRIAGFEEAGILDPAL